MQLQKTTVNTVAGKNAPEPSAKSVSLKSPSTQAAKTGPLTKPSVVTAARSVSSLIAASGLPQDKLSSSIVSFARFFSLPLKPEQLAAIRRQAFAPLPAPPSAETPQSDTVKQTTAENAAAAKNREALSLAAAAAESKGVELQPKGLESFAEAVDPDWQRRQDSGGQNRRQRNKNQNEQKDENGLLKAGSVNASGLKKMALEAAEKDPLLYIMNRLSGKDGRRWIVLPFDFRENGRDFRVSMRILLENEYASNHAVCMALDIAERGDTGRRWLFMLESAKDKAMRLTVCFQPELPSGAQSRLKRELSELLEIPIERVVVKKTAESFPFEKERGDRLPSIDEAV
jgi:hypothetical protein